MLASVASGGVDCVPEFIPSPALLSVSGQHIQRDGDRMVLHDYLGTGAGGPSIRLFDISVPVSPVEIGSIPVPGVRQMEFRGDWIVYRDTLGDLVTIEVGADGSLVERDRVDLFNSPFRSGSGEMALESGVVVLNAATDCPLLDCPWVYRLYEIGSDGSLDLRGDGFGPDIDFTVGGRDGVVYGTIEGSLVAYGSLAAEVGEGIFADGLGLDRSTAWVLDGRFSSDSSTLYAFDRTDPADLRPLPSATFDGWWTSLVVGDGLAVVGTSSPGFSLLFDLRDPEAGARPLGSIAPGASLIVGCTMYLGGNQVRVYDLLPCLPECSAADLAEPFGVLDLGDVDAFVGGFTAGAPIADIDGNGVFDLNDLAGFVTTFVDGCP
jgi:hypothetical protein